MSDKWKSDSCDAINNYCAIYSVPMAAAMWCGVPANQVSDVLKDAIQTTAFDIDHGVWHHPNIPHLVNTSRAITLAIDAGVLPCCLRDGSHAAINTPDDQRYHLRTWVEVDFPTNKPRFLFDQHERCNLPVI